MGNKKCLIVFAKEPHAGFVKTRLAKDIGTDNAAALYRSFLRDTQELTKRVDVAAVILAYDCQTQQEPQVLKSVFLNAPLLQQSGEDLGERMLSAMQFAYSAGYAGCVIIGTDAPLLPPSYIQRAFEVLDRDEVVIGPTDDGGYYLIGAQEPCLELFDHIQWSSPFVFKQTMENITRLGKTVHVLPQYYDVDTLEDLGRLKTEIAEREDCLTSATARFLTNNNF